MACVRGLDVGWTEGARLAATGPLAHSGAWCVIAAASFLFDFSLLCAHCSVICNVVFDRFSRVGTYKLPSMDDIPREFNVHLAQGVKNVKAVHRSRGVGEPPILLSASALFAIRAAVAAARRSAGMRCACVA